MFVKNFNSIKRQTISVDEKLKIYLVQNGYSPISKKDKEWIYISNNEVISLIDKYGGGEGSIGQG